MKKFFLSLGIILFFFSSIGCSSIVDIQQINLDNKNIESILKKENPGTDKIRLITTKPMSDKIIALYSYDRGGQHYNEYRFIGKKDNQLLVMGGNGGMAQYDTNHPFSFLNGSSVSNAGESYCCVVYGEIFDKKIIEMRVEFSDGKVMTGKVINDGYLFLYEVNAFVKKIEALDEDSKVLYHLP